MNNPPIFLKRDKKNGQYLPADETHQKSCSICLKVKPAEDFYPRKNRPLGLSPQCIDCEKKRAARNMRERRRRDPEQARKYDREYRRKNPDKVKNMSLKKNYKIDLIEYKAMFARQEGRCEICSNYDRLNVDHCHSTKKVRSLLCGNCNKGLGHFKDNLQLLEAAIQYLKAHI